MESRPEPANVTGIASAARYAVIDVETTGIDPRRDRIVELAVITVQSDGTAADRWETLVRPEDPGSNPVSGIQREMLAAAPTFAEIAGDAISRLAARGGGRAQRHLRPASARR